MDEIGDSWMTKKKPKETKFSTTSCTYGSFSGTNDMSKLFKWLPNNKYSVFTFSTCQQIFSQKKPNPPQAWDNYINLLFIDAMLRFFLPRDEIHFARGMFVNFSLGSGKLMQYCFMRIFSPVECFPNTKKNQWPNALDFGGRLKFWYRQHNWAYCKVYRFITGWSW